MTSPTGRHMMIASLRAATQEQQDAFPQPAPIGPYTRTQYIVADYYRWPLIRSKDFHEKIQSIDKREQRALKVKGLSASAKEEIRARFRKEYDALYAEESWKTRDWYTSAYYWPSPEKALVQRLIASQRGRCGSYRDPMHKGCGGDLEGSKMHVDHIIPRIMGGGDEEENLQVLHSSCNLAASDDVSDEALISYAIRRWVEKR